MLIQENKWRAVRWGLDGKMIDFGKQKEVPTRDLVLELLDFVDDVLDELGLAQRDRAYPHDSRAAYVGRRATPRLQRNKRSEGRCRSPD